MAGGNVEMMVSVVPGTMTGFASLNAGLASINNAFLNMTQAISDNFGLVDTAIITSGVVIAQVAADAMKAFGDFEQSMKIVQMVSGQTADDISFLGQKANEFAVQYRVDIDQITEGLQTLGRAGLNSASEQTEVLQNGLSTAKLEARDLNGVLEELIQNTALLGGDLKTSNFGEQSRYVNDLLVATSMTAPITTHDVSETLKYSGGIAAAAGANIESEEGKRLLEDYMGTIAAFAQKGVTGSIAGTALRAFLNKPATQDKSVVEGLATIHLKPEYLWEDDQETMKPISEQIALIQSQMDKLNVPKMDRLQIWSKIVGGKMGQQMIKLDSNDIKDLTDDIQKAEAAESLANKSMQTFNANINEMGQRGAAAFRDFGSKLVWIFNPALELINKVLDFLTTPFGSYPLVAGFLWFMNLVISKIKSVFGAFREGVQNIWRDYKSGEMLSIRQYRGDGLGGQGGGSSYDSSLLPVKEAVTPKSFADAWKNAPILKMWDDYQKGILTENEYGTITSTRSWSGKNKWLDKKGFEIRDNDLIEQLAYRNLLTEKQMQDIQKGITKSAFMGEHGKDIGLKYLTDIKKLTDNELEEILNPESSKTKKDKKKDEKKDEKKDKKKDTDDDILHNEAQANRKRIEDMKLAAVKINTTWKNMLTGMETNLSAASQRIVSETLGHNLDGYADTYNTQKRYYDNVMKDYMEDRFYSSINNKPKTPLTLEQRPENIFKPDSEIEKIKNNRIHRITDMESDDTMMLAEKYSRAIKDYKKKELEIEKQILNTKRQEYVDSNINKANTQKYINESAERNASTKHIKTPSTITTYEELAKQLDKDATTISKETQDLWRKQQPKNPSTITSYEDLVKDLDEDAVTITSETRDYWDKQDKMFQDQMAIGASFRDRLSQKKDSLMNSVKGTGSTFFDNIKNSILNPREGRTLGFANKGIGKLGNAALNVADMFGGTLMIAMMAFTAIIEHVSKLYQEYCAELKEATEAVDDAYKKRDEAEKNLQKTYSENGMGEEDLESTMADAYEQLSNDLNEGNQAWREKAGQKISEGLQQYEYDEEADDGSTKEKEKEEETYESAINQNTAALYAATAELRIAMDKLVSKMSDKAWGMDGISTQISDGLGALSDGLYGGSNFSEEGNFLMTASQKDENYAGYTELAGLMLEDLHDAEGDWRKGFQTLLGKQDGKNIANQLSLPAQKAMDNYGNFVKGLSRADNSRLQSSMKRNKKDWQGLAKEIAKYEKKNKTKVGENKTDNKRLEKLVSKLATETGLSRLRVLNAASLQQLQDMYQIAQAAIVPIMSQQAATSAQHYQTAVNGINPAANEGAAGAQDTAANAAAIAAMLSVIAQTKAVEAAWQAGIMAGDKDAMDSKDANEYLKKASGNKLAFDVSGIQSVAYGAGREISKALGWSQDKYDLGWNAANKLLGTQDGEINLGRYGQSQKAMDNILNTFTQMGERARHPDWSDDQIYQKASEKLAGYKDSEGNYKFGMDSMMRMARENYQDAIAPSVMDAYLASNIGDSEGSDGGGGGSGGGGGDSGDKDKGTKKERVDLVLCNKKEIPKLNVNLFKKPPSFTVLNKNFKLRDIKVNTQDKPKAVLSSIKNAIIDVQKRSDPKIIQDEGGEYDPAGATDGRSVPSGSTNTSTD